LASTPLSFKDLAPFTTSHSDSDIIRSTQQLDQHFITFKKVSCTYRVKSSAATFDQSFTESLNSLNNLLGRQNHMNERTTLVITDLHLDLINQSSRAVFAKTIITT